MMMRFLSTWAAISAKIHEDVKIIRSGAFADRKTLIYVEFHDGIEIIERNAFFRCDNLRMQNYGASRASAIGLSVVQA